MNIDIGFWLSLAVVIGLVFWGADKLFHLREKGPKAIKDTVEFTNSMLPVFFVVLVIRSFIVEPFTIPSGSMIPSLEVNDFIIVNKFSYGLRHPVTNTKIVSVGEPKRGDIMVFRYPVNPKQNFIKRVVGLPGDIVEQRDGRLYINGEVVPQKELSQQRRGAIRARQLTETIDGHPHLLRPEWATPDAGGWQQRTAKGVWEVPAGHYFGIGDNRDNSSDSRCWCFIPEDHIVGRAMGIWMHWKPIFSVPKFHRNWAIDKVANDTKTDE